MEPRIEKNVVKAIPYVAAEEGEEGEEWKIEALKDLTEALYDGKVLPYFTRMEIDDIRQYLATC